MCQKLNIGQEGDTRQFKRLRKSDYYAAKAAFDAKQVTKWAKCQTCGQELRTLNWDGYCMRCKR